jgi:UDP:flavonoid glycosyltransferase YjiC (YdhE family)
VPAVPVPIANDQPFWARRLHALGVAPQFVPRPDLTPERPGTAISSAVRDPAHRRNAQQIPKKLAAEDGIETALRALDQLTRPTPLG